MFARLMHVALVHLAFVAAAVATIAGCGGSEASTPRAPVTSTSAGTAHVKAPAHAPGLAKPIYLRCGVGRFKKPSATPLVAPGGAQYWRIVYLTPVTAPNIRGLPRNVTIVEQAPAGARGALQGGHDVAIAGRTVSLRPGNTKTPANVAQWKTHKARYILLADGSLAQLRRLIPCFP
jgi:hypothetical protein